MKVLINLDEPIRDDTIHTSMNTVHIHKKFEFNKYRYGVKVSLLNRDKQKDSRTRGELTIGKQQR